MNSSKFRQSCLGLITLFTILMLAPRGASAAQVTVTWIGGAGNWTDSAKWIGLPASASFPNNGTPAGTTYNVRIDNSNAAVSNVNMDFSSTVDALNISAGDSLTIVNGNTLGVVNSGAGTGIINNAGTINLSASNFFTGLLIDGDITLSGGGNVTMSDSSNNHIRGGVNVDRLINVNNTISGGGTVGDGLMALTNQGIISASQPAGLVVDPDLNNAINTGTMRAVNGSTLTLQAGTFTNTGGLIRADSSGGNSIVAVSIIATVTGGTTDLTGGGSGELQISGGSTIGGGTVTNNATGTIRNVSSTNTIGGAITNPAGGKIFITGGSTLQITGGSTCSNGGDIRLDSSGSTTQFKVSGGNLTLTGGGTVTMSNNINNRITGAASTDRLTNADNTISGSGQIGAGFMAFTNQGVVQANQSAGIVIDPSSTGAINSGTMRAVGASSLTLQSGAFTNTGGLIRTDSTGGNAVVSVSGNSTVTGGTVDLVGAGNGELRLNGSDVTGGTVTNNATGTIRAQSSTSTLGGAVTNPAGGNVVVDNGSTLVFTSVSTYSNAGNIAINSTGSTTSLQVSGGNVTLSGGGAVTMGNNVNNRITGVASSDRLINANNTISGAGQIGANFMAFTNQAVVQANQSVGIIIDPSSGNTVFNTGTIRAVGASSLTLQGGVFNNTGGLIRADSTGGSAVVQVNSNSTVTGGTVDLVGAGNGELRLNGSDITGGTVTNNATGTIRAQSSTNTLGGAVTNPAGGAIAINNGATLAFTSGSTYNNAGDISINSTGSTTSLQVSGGDVTLAGGGTVTMGNNINNRIIGALGTDRLINSNNTISGAGQIGGNSMALTNQSVIQANQSVGIVVDPSANGAINSGTMRAVGASSLTLQGGNFNNTGGLIRADSTGGNAVVQVNNSSTVTAGTVDLVGAGNGEVRLNSGAINIATVTNNATGTIRAQSSTNTIGGILTNPVGGKIIINNGANLELVAGGTYSNSGDISLNSSGATTQLMVINGDVTLTGGGTVTMGDNSNNRIIGGAASDRLINANNTISGAGQIGVGLMAFTNQGTVRADQATGMTINITPSATGFTTSGNVIVNSGITLTMGAGDVFTQTAGSTIVNGTLTLDTTLQLQGGILGGGGTVSANVNNSGGTVAPGNSPGRLTALDYSQGASGAFNVELEGLAAGEEYDQFELDGAVTLNGALNVVPGFSASVGDSFTIINKTSAGAVTGNFAGLLEGGTFSASGFDFHINYAAGDGNDVVITIDSISQFSIANASVNENAGTVTLTVTRNGTISAAASVGFTTANATALAGFDYASLTGTANFTAGNPTTTFTVPILNTVACEPIETFTVTLNNPVGGIIGAPSTATVTIFDDDCSFTISGRVTNHSGTGIPNVQITRNGGSNVVTDANGNFVFTGVKQGNYTIAPLITPALNGVTFFPLSYNVTVNTSNLTNIAFSVSFTVTGTVSNHSGTGIPNIQVTRQTPTSSVTAVTDAQGKYTFTGVRSGSYTVTPVVTPSMTGISFFPTSTNITVNTNNLTNINFQASFSISGRIVNSSNVGIQNVLVTRSTPTSSTSVLTNASGDYIFGGVRSGTYTITPTKSGSTFNPVSKSATVGTQNLTNINFIGSP